MKTFEAHLTGVTPLIMHRDSVEFADKVDAWIKIPANKKKSIAGDDRTPAWKWIGYLYYHENGKNVICMDSDNLMTMLREGGVKKIFKNKETYKKYTQTDLIIQNVESTFLVNGKEISMEPILKLQDDLDFSRHEKLAEELGFELFIKRAKVGTNKHIRVRPLFRNWEVITYISIIDEETSQINGSKLLEILTLAGYYCGLCDWRPGCDASGSFGRFSVKLFDEGGKEVEIDEGGKKKRKSKDFN